MQDSGTRVWVQLSAIEALKGNKQSKSFRRSSTLPNSQGSLNGSFTGFADIDSCLTDTSASSLGRHAQWGWRAGSLVDSDSTAIVVRFDAQMLQIADESETISLPPTAIQDGVIVLANELPCNESGVVQPPHDLITLTHLHEPAVVESLQHRYAADQIYTNTGPVLLALNPFQSIRGLYGETVMKKYFDRAERSLNTGLPPHIYAIADSSYRAMMRSLEENLENVSIQANQSILVSGESGSGKTVSTKFLMKYLAALSQRSAVLHAQGKRAYVKVKEANSPHISQPASPLRMSSSVRKGFEQPPWASVGKKDAQNKTPAWRKSGSSLLSGNHHESDNVLSSVSFIPGSNASESIESQVLQSNPILESFGNARTTRNDNSSRFGKFIEIQFTRSGKLVGAQIDTYLLEKVRLVSQSHGERNYHIFYELLSGAIDHQELAEMFLARAASPTDFKLTANGACNRRDGVSDVETYRMLRQAMNTMKFSNENVKEVFRLAAAILHASNLTFTELSDDTCTLDETNVSFLPVCNLLGVFPHDLRDSLCSFTIQAGNTLIKRSLDKEHAYKGLQGLIKATYGALFDYLVTRINNSIAFKNHIIDESAHDTEDKSTPFSDGPNSAMNRKPVASIGVLDIFGFESFTQNSFEQLCINYCNEALQQQFNAFVLKNEQAEYEREDIEWSFIEFPENQDVLDLLEKRGTGIFSLLDDQCRAPGPSDKAFALGLYSNCKGQSRFVASRRQLANLQFSVEHYAGPVEYTTDGFVEKNRDELPKESIELLRNSQAGFIRNLADFMDLTDSIETNKLPTPMKFHRADSSVGRATVGGQFRRQLKLLRQKIDLTTPHYVRCLKPNDMLVPDTFDRGIVAEQLRCGGILEAVRVARAGFTQHYPHADFVRRYRSLAWKELSKKTFRESKGVGSPCNSPYARGKGSNRSKIRQVSSFIPGSPKRLPTLPIESSGSSENTKEICKGLIDVLYRKLVSLELESSNNNAIRNAECGSCPYVISEPASPVAKAKIYSHTSSSPSWSAVSLRKNYPVQTQPSLSSDASPSTAPPGLPIPLAATHGDQKATIALTVTRSSVCPASSETPDKKAVQSRYTPWGKSKQSESPRSPAVILGIPAWKKGGPTASDFAKVGIQMGKTKIFLRHQAFEALERIRGIEQAKAATKLNSMFRRYLARIAYIPYRDAFRLEVRDLRRRFEEESGEYKETKEGDPGDIYCDSYNGRLLSSIRNSFQHGSGGGDSLVDKWFESKIRDAIHNPVPRHQWGKRAPSRETTFKWVIRDGMWVKNYNFVEYQP